MVSTMHRWKNLFGEQLPRTFDSLTPKTNSATDGSLIGVSSDFIAVNWHSTGGGQIGVFQTTNFLRVKNEFPVIRGHTAPVTDLKFSPFNSGLLASASDDGTVKLWSIPEEGLQEDMNTELQAFSNHSRKACLIDFHPTVKELVASAGSHNDLFVWNITDASVVKSLKMVDQAYSMEWNSKGNLLGVMTKNKKANIYDVRSTEENAVLTIDGHSSAKVQKFGFADGDYAFSTGFSNSGYREIKLYDTRKFDKELSAHKLDTMSGMLSHYYDNDANLLFLFGKGEGAISFYEMHGGEYKFANAYSGGDQSVGTAFFPKRTMDYNSCEIDRAAKLTKDSCVYVSFKYPRRNKGYDEEFYPEVVIGEPSTTLEEWQAGTDKPLERKNITEIENKFKSEPIVFDKKPVEARQSKVVASLEDTLKENAQLKEKVKELESQVEELQKKLTEAGIQ